MGASLSAVVKECVIVAGAEVIGAVVDTTVGDLVRTGALVVGAWVGAIVRACLLGDCEGAVIGALAGAVVIDCVVDAFFEFVEAREVGALVTRAMVSGDVVDETTIGELVRIGSLVVGA